MEVRTQGPLVKIGKRTKRISLQRFLLSKVIYEPRQVRLSEWSCLFENQLWLERKCLADEGFFRKFADDVFTLSHYLKESDLKGLIQSNIVKFSTKVRNNLSSFLVPERNYPQWKSRFGGRFTFHPEVLDRELSEFYRPSGHKPRRTMGIGYRDKGSRRKPEDGSPDWREVASVTSSSNDIEEEIKNARDFKDIERVFVKTFPKEDWSAYYAGKRNSVSAKHPETVKGKKATTEG